MNKITEITRRDLIQGIETGFFIDATPFSPHKRKVSICFHGVMSEEQFLSRLYPLDQMASNDSRFDSLLYEYRCHRVAFDDYPDFWFFEDKRFDLRDGCDDEPLLRFLAEMFHPLVRDEGLPWRQVLAAVNGLLEKDGWELCPVESISGRDVYGFKELFMVVQVSEANEAAEPGIKSLINQAKNLFEKGTLDETKTAVEKLWDAFERLKTVISEDKKQSSKHLIQIINFEGDEFQQLLEKEFRDLTAIGNHYRIRHHEMGKLDLVDLRSWQYLYNRCLSILSLAVSSVAWEEIGSFSHDNAETGNSTYDYKDQP